VRRIDEGKSEMYYIGIGRYWVGRMDAGGRRKREVEKAYRGGGEVGGERVVATMLFSEIRYWWLSLWLLNAL